MQLSEFQAGAIWAYRRERTWTSPAERVELIQMVQKGKARQTKVRWLDGDAAGMEGFVKNPDLLCPWKEWPKWLREEQREKTLYEYVCDHDDSDRVVAEAATLVLESTGERNVHVEEHRGYTRWLEKAGLERVSRRAGLEPQAWHHHLAFRARDDCWVLPNSSLICLAEAFARAEPDTVNRYLDQGEEQLRAGGFDPGNRWQHEHLRTKLPAFSVARQWAAQRDRSDLKVEIERLQNLMRRAIYRFEALGHVREARQFERGLQGK